MITTDFMPASDLAKIIDTSTNNVGKAATEGHIIDGKYEVERRNVRGDEKQHPRQKYVYRAIQVVRGSTTTKVDDPRVSTAPAADTSRIKSPEPEATDWMASDDLADLLDVANSTVTVATCKGNIVSKRYRIEKRKITAEEREKHNFLHRKKVYRAIDITGAKAPTMPEPEPQKVTGARAEMMSLTQKLNGPEVELFEEEDDRAERSTQAIVIAAALVAGVLLLALATKVLL